MADTVIVVVRRPFSWLKFFQLLCGLICFGLYFHYRRTVVPATICNASDDDIIFVRSTFTTTAIVGYPFVIVLLILISLGVSGSSLETSILCFLLNFVGFGMYLTIGGLVAHCSSEYGSEDEVKGFAAMTFITSFLFLCDVVIAILQRCRK